MRRVVRALTNGELQVDFNFAFRDPTAELLKAIDKFPARNKL